MTLRRLAIVVLGILGVGVLALMGFLAWQEGSAGEAAGWFTAGLLALREVVSKIENVALNIRSGAQSEPEE